MLRKMMICLCIAALVSGFAACSKPQTETTASEPTTLTNAQLEDSETSASKKAAAKDENEKKGEMKVTVQIGNQSFSATLEKNAAAQAFYEMVQKEAVHIDMREYSGFEKVGALGKTLPAEDEQTTTQAGDIVLYNSNQIVLFYGSNTWSYTRLGRVDTLDGWEQALGSGDITVSFQA